MAHYVLIGEVWTRRPIDTPDFFGELNFIKGWYGFSETGFGIRVCVFVCGCVLMAS